MVRIVFGDFPQIGEDQLLNDGEFYEYLKDGNKEENIGFIPQFKGYISEFGFDMETHFISPAQLHRHHLVYQFYCAGRPATKAVKEKVNVFVHTKKETGTEG